MVGEKAFASALIYILLAAAVVTVLLQEYLEAAHLTVLRYDQIAKVTGQPCQWVAPPGSID